MKCPNCGSEINDNARFCPVCGAPQNPQQTPNSGAASGKQNQPPVQPSQPQYQQAPQYQQYNQSQYQQPVNNQPPKPKKNKKVIIIIVVIAIAAVVVLYLLFGRGKAISVTEGVEPTFSGGNGYGYVSMDTDVPDTSKNQAAKDFEDQLSQATGDSIGDLLSGNASVGKGNKTAAMYQFAMSLDCKWEDEDGKEVKQGKLKNDDKVVYACTYNKDAGKKAGYRFTDLKTTYTVKGLKKIKDIDVFENVTVDWKLDGDDAEPEITVKDGTDQQKEQEKGTVTYDYDYSSDGTVTVTAYINQESLIDDGYHAKGLDDIDGKLTKDYDIGAQPVEITNTSDPDALAAAQKVTDPLIKQDIASCNNTLSEETYDSDTDTPLTIKDGGYTVKGLDDDWYGMDVVYNVTAGGLTFERSYSVAVYKFADGTYKAVSIGDDDEDSNSVSCQVYVSDYDDTYTWN